MEWCHENCPWAESTDWSTAGEQSKLLHDLYEGKKPEMRFGVNLRDLPESLAASPERVYKVVDFLTSLPEVGLTRLVRVVSSLAFSSLNRFSDLSLIFTMGW